MSSKKKQQKPKSRTSPAPAKFTTGTQVRVKAGTLDPDFPDIPLGGWAGKIQEVNQQSKQPTCLIAWNKHTLDHMHPIYRKRCERDGLELESMWPRRGGHRARQRWTHHHRTANEHYHPSAE